MNSFSSGEVIPQPQQRAATGHETASRRQVRRRAAPVGMITLTYKGIDQLHATRHRQIFRSQVEYEHKVTHTAT